MKRLQPFRKISLRAWLVLLTIVCVVTAVGTWQFKRLAALHRLSKLQINFNTVPTYIERQAFTVTYDSDQHVWLDPKSFTWRDVFRRFDRISLNTTGISEQTRHEIGTLLALFPEVDTLALTTDDVAADFSEFQNTLSRVHSLRLSCNRLPCNVAFPQQLKEIALNVETFQGDSLRSLSTSSNLKTLDLSGNDVTDKDLQILLELKSLQSVRLDRTYVSAKGVQALDSHPTLRTVSAQNSRFIQLPPLSCDARASFPSDATTHKP